MTRIALLGAALTLLAGCASDGGFAGDARPVDKTVTLERLCSAISTADAAFQALVKAKPELLDENAVAVEAAVVKAAAPVCAAGYDGDLDVAIRTAVSVLTQVTVVMQEWQRT